MKLPLNADLYEKVKYEDSDLFDEIQEIIETKDCYQDLLSLLSLAYNRYLNGDITQGSLLDHVKVIVLEFDEENK